MSDVMQFPDNWWTFVQNYQIKDSDEVYTNGSMLIPSFRVRQMVEHYFGGEVGKESDETCEMLLVPRFCPPGCMVPQDMVRECSMCHGIVDGRESGAGSPDDPYQWADVPDCMICCPTCGRRIRR